MRAEDGNAAVVAAEGMAPSMLMKWQKHVKAG